MAEIDWDAPLPTEPDELHPDPCPGECGHFVPRGAGKCIACWLKYNRRSVRIDRRDRREGTGRKRY